MRKQTRPRRLLRRPSVEGLESRRLLASFVVNSTADTLSPPAGTVTLRSAITASNATTGPNTITFNLPSGSTISPGSALPQITQPVTINGVSSGKPGIIIDGTSAGTGTNGFTLGSTGVEVEGLDIVHFNGTGIEINSPGGDTVAQDYIGVNAAGSAAAPNHVDGIFVFNSSNNTIGGSGAASNVISGNQETGVDLAGGSNNNVVSFDVVGANVTGTAAVANNIGISEEDGTGNLIANDLVSGNTAGGISLESGSSNLVRASLIGTDTTGSSAIGNGSFGINILGETGTTIGVAGFGAGNDVAGNTGPGITISDSTNTVVANTVVGMNKGATAAIPNTLDGILVANTSTGTTIGGTSPSLGNFISGNGDNGVDVELGSTGTVIEKTHIGSDVTGLLGIANGQNGIQFNQTSGQVLFDSIVDDGQSGVLLEGGSGTLITGSYIGDVAAGTHGNAADGVFVFGSNNNTIGGASAGNVISSNGQYGVTVENGSKNNLISSNFIGLNGEGGPGRGNSNGVAVFDSTGTTVGGVTGTGGNVISSNTNYGVDVHGADSGGTVIEGNIIGLSASGAAAPNASGIILDGTAGVLISQNVISANTVDGVFVSGGFSSVLTRNLIGTDVTGFTGEGNGGDGVDIVGATFITVGGTSSSLTNVIAGNSGYGVQISGAGATNNTIEGDLIGVNLSGRTALGNGASGIWVNNVPLTTIGGAPQAYNVIANSGAQGILITGSAATGTSVVNNYLGIDADGITLGPNADDGILVQGTPGVTIAFNLISGNKANGVHISSGATGAAIFGNLIGTDVFGANPKANGLAGVFIDNTSGSQIGGTSSSARNVISGNTEDGILISGSSATGNTVAGNFIGTTSNGAAALANKVDGVLVEGPGNTIGGTASGSRNVISGNGSAGVHLAGGGSHNLVAGNFIGTDLNGATAIGNGFYGVSVDGSGTTASNNNTIGGSTTAAQNVISGSGVVNVNVGGPLATGTLIAGNLIGTNLAGTFGLFATTYGVILNDAPSNTVGGTTAGMGNTISGSTSIGLYIVNPGASTNLVQGNLIGRATSGNPSLANGLGVSILSAPNNTVGGAASGAANTITGNTTNAIQVAGSGATGNQITGNNVGP